MKKITTFIFLFFSFLLKAQTDTLFKHKNTDCNTFNSKGAIVFVPQNAFCFENDRPCSDTIIIKFREFAIKSIESYNLNMQALIGGKTQLLQPTAMFQIQAECNGIPLKINKNAEIQIRIKRMQKIGKLQAYKYDTQKNTFANYSEVFDFSFNDDRPSMESIWGNSDLKYCSEAARKQQEDLLKQQQEEYPQKKEEWKKKMEEWKKNVREGKIKEQVTRVVVIDAGHTTSVIEGVAAPSMPGEPNFKLTEPDFKNCFFKGTFKGINLKQLGIYCFDKTLRNENKIQDKNIYSQGEAIRVLLNEKFNLPAKDLPQHLIKAYCAGLITGYYPLRVDSVCSFSEFQNHFAFVEQSYLPIDYISELHYTDLPNCCPTNIKNCEYHCSYIVNVEKAKCLNCDYSNLCGINYFSTYYDIIQQKRFDKNTASQVYDIRYIRLVYVYEKINGTKINMLGPVFKYEDVIALNRDDFKLMNPKNGAANLTLKEYFQKRFFQSVLLKTSLLDNEKNPDREKREQESNMWDE